MRLGLFNPATRSFGESVAMKKNIMTKNSYIKVGNIIMRKDIYNTQPFYRLTMPGSDLVLCLISHSLAYHIHLIVILLFKCNSLYKFSLLG